MQLGSSVLFLWTKSPGGREPHKEPIPSAVGDRAYSVPSGEGTLAGSAPLPSEEEGGVALDWAGS